MALNVLIAETEPGLAAAIRLKFEAEGFATRQATSGDEVERLTAANPPDLLLLDWNLPNTPGIEICRRLRLSPATKEIPIILLTSCSSEADCVSGLATGADDYVVKPVSLSELLARARAVIRRASQDRNDVIRHGDIEVDRAARLVRRGARRVKMGPTEYRLLEFFIESPGRVMSRDQIRNVVWGATAEVDIRTIDVHVGRLRKALIRGHEADPIRTVRGIGYVLRT